MAEVQRPAPRGDGRFERHLDEAPTKELLRELSEEVRELVRDEARVAREEARTLGKRAAAGGGLTGAGVYLAAIGGIGLMQCVIFALSLVWPAWASALAVGGALVIIGGAIAAAGARQLREIKPQRTLSHLQEEKQWLMSTLRDLPAQRRSETSA
jgi:hypothetical protein